MPDIKKVQIPEILSLEKNREETLKFLSFVSLQNKKNRKRRRKGTGAPSEYFDFTNLKEICPATALILCAVYDVYQRRGGDFRVFDYDEWDAGVKETFAQIGFFKWLDFKGLPSAGNVVGELPIRAFESEVLHIPAKPVTYLQDLIEAFNNIRERASKTIIDEETSSRVASAILEAVENSVRHAYHDGIPKDVRRRWWVGGVSNPKSGEVMVACYDCGVSIPGSIAGSVLDDQRGVRTYVQGVFRRYLRRSVTEEVGHELDHKRLQVALKYLATTSGVAGGGKGLAHIATTIDDCQDGTVEIFTRRAHFYVKKGDVGRCSLLPEEMPGTLIVWRMQLYG
ncbi:hypothetical protein [Yoonia vestfoldensis]|uniref:Uncharacterized protein n=1 Tax=Yoonia vestfoldensis TaxID=245188 RepID=A0A1Y0EH97_9RHOB|nr:hypothetical protein [Yoonia vestfoldensis]ARU03006.1 hypothetical protein LOKVESSMR4R_03740 [Yoonia vestfoldensis]